MLTLTLDAITGAGGAFDDITGAGGVLIFLAGAEKMIFLFYLNSRTYPGLKKCEIF